MEIARALESQRSSRILPGMTFPLADLSTLGCYQSLLIWWLGFLFVIDWIMKSTLAGQMLSIQWILMTLLEDVDFTNDLTLISHTLTDIQKKVDMLTQTSLKGGLNINRNKTEAMRINNRCEGSANLNGIP